MTSKLRVVVLGDVHYREEDRPLWERAIEDLNALSPDLVLAVGDLTGGGVTGTPEGMREAVAMLNRLEAPWHTVIGNHDLQAKQFDTDADAVASFLSFTERDTPWFRTDLGPLTIIGLSNTQWRRNGSHPNEIVFEEEQLEWCQRELAAIPDRPVFILAHVSPIGSGLMSMAELHASVGGNAFANQNHCPGRVMNLVRDNPNVLMWFSGHNHLGQHYRDSISVRLGVHFVHSAVIGRQSRDGYRQSRVIDVSPEKLAIRTFDHSLRRLDESLTREEPHGLEELLDYRKTIHTHRFVPADPVTMRQGPGPTMRRSRERRFAFLSDAHVVDEISACQERIFEWTIQQVIGRGVDELVLGGDLTHHASAGHARAFCRAVAPARRPMVYLPGNNETRKIASKDFFPNCSFVSRLERLSEWPGQVFALATTDKEDARELVEALAAALPEAGTVLVLAHFPPAVAGEEALAKLDRPGMSIDWVCGHNHQGETRREGAVRVHVCGGLDPVKIRGHGPEILIGDWDGEELKLQRVEAPPAVLATPSPRPNPLGLAFRGTPAVVLKTALEEDVPVIQFRGADIEGPPEDGEIERMREFRQRFGPGYLSLHLPNFVPAEEGLDAAAMDFHLDWAGKMGVDDLTVHLPAVPARRIYGPEGEWLDTPWARSCLSAYLALAEQAIGMGATLSLENVYHKGRVPPEEEKLSTRPWHLVRFVEILRSKLLENGYPPEGVEKVGIILDAGHAFRDAVVAKEHGLADWVRRVSPFLQLAHIHQTLPRDGKVTNHHPITDPAGPYINYLGFLPILEESTPRRVPLLIEVRSREGALESYRNLLAAGVAGNGAWPR